MAPHPTEERTVDVIVAGGGHNGLVAACYLARAGLDVQVVEAHSTVGGMTATNPMTPEAPEHMINDASIHASLFNMTGIDEELGLSRRFGLRARPIDPAHVHLGPEGESIAMWRDHARTAEEIRHFSPRDARAYLELTRVIDHAVAMGVPLMQTNPVRPEPRRLLQSAAAAVHGRRSLPKVLQWVMSSQAGTVEEYFEHEMVKGPFTSNLPFMRFGDDMSGWALIYLGVLSRYGVRMFEGGTGAFPAALVRCLEAHGGAVRTGAPVRELLVEGGRVAGVVLDEGEQVRARHGVLTAFSPATVLNRLLPEGVLPPSLQARARRIPTTSTGMTDYKLNLALRGRLTMSKHTAWRRDGLDLRLPCTTWNTHAQALAADEACRRGEVPEMIPGLSQITTAFDPSMAPSGHDTFWFWSGITPTHPRDGWEVARKQITDRVISDAGHYFDGIDELEIARRPLAMPDIEDRFWAVDGNVYHVDPILTRFGPFKPAFGFAGYRTPVPGLFLSGSGTHPVAGISGLPGRTAARELIRTTRREGTRRDALAGARLRGRALDALAARV